MAFDSKYALNDAIRYLTKVAERRAAGGWVPPKERERQQRDAMRQEQQQARQAEKQQQAQQKQFIADEKERQKNLAAFQKGNHPDVPHVLYHGTTGDFNVFDRRKANIESDHGQGFYASNNIEDVNPNYAGEGPDLTGKIERFIERNFYDDDENEMTPDEMREAAKRALNVHHRGAVMPIHVSMKNPVVIGGKNETFYDFEHPYNEKTDEYGEPKGSLLKVIDGVERAARQFDVDDYTMQDFKGRLYEKALDNGGIHASDLEKLIKDHFQNTYDNETGDYAEKELWRTAMEEAGHDGIIDHTVNSKFGTDRRGFAGARIPGMAGVNQNTSHYIVFNPNQIKSATGNQGTFDPSNPDITKSEGGPILSKQFPTQYMPNVGRQVMNTGGTPDDQPISLAESLSAKFPDVEHSISEKPDHISVDMIRVPEEHRGKGIGSAVMKHIADYADQTGKDVFLTPEPMGSGSKPKLIDWYKSQGFKPNQGRGKDFRSRASMIRQSKYDKDRQGLNIGGTPDQPQRQLSPMGFYSAAAERASTLQPSGDAVQMVNALKNTQGIKTEELQNAGLIDESGNVHPDWAGRGKVTRDELVSHLQGQMPQVEETVLGGRRSNYQPKYSQYTLPGGENYREVLLKLPKKGIGSNSEFLVTGKMPQTFDSREEAEEYIKKIQDMQNEMPHFNFYEFPVNIVEQPKQGFSDTDNFYSQHWRDDPNVLAHIRMSDRIGPNGEKILHVEELQSDWGQKGKKEGFVDQNRITPEEEIEYAKLQNIDRRDRTESQQNRLDELLAKEEKQHGTVPSAPYVTSTEGWTDLALKRVLKEAAEGGYDKIVWTPGAEQAKRYDLSTHIGELRYEPFEEDGKKFYQIEALDPSGKGVFEHEGMNESDLESHFGKEVAQKILDDHGKFMESRPLRDWRSLTGLDLQTGGEGMKGYYDSIVPKRLQNLAKKHDKNAKVGYVNLGGIVAPNTELDELSGAINFDRPKKEKPKLQFNLPSLDITPAMRESILRGQSAYKRGGTVSKKHPALSIAGTHIREETHGKPIFTGRL